MRHTGHPTNDPAIPLFYSNLFISYPFTWPIHSPFRSIHIVFCHKGPPYPSPLSLWASKQGAILPRLWCCHSAINLIHALHTDVMWSEVWCDVRVLQCSRKKTHVKRTINSQQFSCQQCLSAPLSLSVCRTPSKQKPSVFVPWPGHQLVVRGLFRAPDLLVGFLVGGQVKGWVLQVTRRWALGVRCIGKYCPRAVGQGSIMAPLYTDGTAKPKSKCCGLLSPGPPYLLLACLLAYLPTTYHLFDI